jgi:hypothetical protein
MLTISPRTSIGVSAATQATIMPMRSWLRYGVLSVWCTRENMVGMNGDLKAAGEVFDWDRTGPASCGTVKLLSNDLRAAAYAAGLSDDLR